MSRIFNLLNYCLNNLCEVCSLNAPLFCRCWFVFKLVTDSFAWVHSNRSLSLPFIHSGLSSLMTTLPVSNLEEFFFLFTPQVKSFKVYLCYPGMLWLHHWWKKHLCFLEASEFDGNLQLSDSIARAKYALLSCAQAEQHSDSARRDWSLCQALWFL